MRWKALYGAAGTEKEKPFHRGGKKKKLRGRTRSLSKRFSKTAWTN